MKPREAKYLGAFLHDIGKFTYRAFDYKMTHEKLGVDLFLTHLAASRIFKSDVELKQKVADYIKRGLESIKMADFEGAREREETLQSSRFTRRPLISIFQRVFLGERDNKSFLQNYLFPTTYYYLPDPIQTDNIISKLSYVKGNVLSWELTEEEEKVFIRLHYHSYSSFLKDLEILKPIGNFRAYFSTLFKIFEKYTSRVSSAGYASVPDISLFDHSRVVAALSICFEEGDSDEECLLIKGDLSGIQNFIFYQIEEAEKASKQLRGRSFYVRILTDAIANYLARELDIFDANILMCSGGHFLILAPNNKRNRTKLVDIEKKINKVLLNNFGGILQVILAYIPVSGNKIIEDFHNAYNNLEFQLINEKRKKSFLNLGDLMTEAKEPEKEDKFEDLFIEIGGKLVHSDILIEIVFPPQERSGYLGNLDRTLIDFSEFGCCYVFAKTQEIEFIVELLRQHSFDYLLVHNIKDTDFEYIKNILAKIEHLPNLGFSYKFVGSFIPTDKYKPLSFEELAKLEPIEQNTANNPKPNEDKEKERYPLLGVVRMDVDNLGEIFAFGLMTAKEEKEESKLFSISRLATLSRELDLFFNGYINKLAQKHFVYLVYSGGDDLFAVGSWENIMEFALELKEKFKFFTCNNPFFTISCGIVFVKPYYPVKRFANESSVVLNKAKNYIDKDAQEKQATKNKIFVFDRVVTWNEFERLLKIGKSIARVLLLRDSSEKTLSRGFIYKLLTLTRKCFNENGDLITEEFYKTISKLHYYFARKGVNSEVIGQSNIRLNDKVIKVIFEKKPDEINITYFLRLLARYFIGSEETERKKWFFNFDIPASYVLLKTRKVKSIKE